LFSGSTLLAGAATDQTQALVIARSVMDQALWRIDLDEGVDRDRIDEFSWTREVRTVDPSLGRADAGELGEEERESEDFELKAIYVTVSWTNAGGIEKEVQMSSARLMEKF
jgi:hypothetical protein